MWSPTTWDDVTAAVNVLFEGDDLDFKDARALGRSEEVAKDIAAMSIYGGTLAYGIDEQNELAVAHPGVSLSGQANRVQQIADTGIRPSVDVDIRPLEDPAQSGHGVLVVVVPASFSAPHMTGDRYPARSGTTTRYLSEAEVERLYEQRRAVSKGGTGRVAFNDFRHSGGLIPNRLSGSLGVLQLYVEPSVPQRHPQKARLSLPLSDAVRLAMQTVVPFVRPDSTPSLLEELDRWRPEGTIGWTAGATFESSADIEWFRFGVPAAATYTHAGNFSFQAATAVVLEAGQRCAYESIWARETMAALAIAGAFYRGIPGITFVYADLLLAGLEGAKTAKLWESGRVLIRNPLEIKDSSYQESGNFSVRELASDPRKCNTRPARSSLRFVPWRCRRSRRTRVGRRMPFSPTVREEVLIRSRRSCCVCRAFAGRDVDVHHIVPQAEGGSDEIDNAIALCDRCHGEAGHYNQQHPLGIKYSRSELRSHRDQWWSFVERNPAVALPAEPISISPSAVPLAGGGRRRVLLDINNKSNDALYRVALIVVLQAYAKEWGVHWDRIEPAPNFSSRVGGIKVFWDLLALGAISPNGDRAIWLFVHTLAPHTLHRLPMWFEPPAGVRGADPAQALILLASFDLEQPPIHERLNAEGHPEALMKVTAYGQDYWVGPSARPAP
jgi:5-methylcytosine-specific restriction endonuclease McrA